jgi:hypothetical protein
MWEVILLLLVFHPTSSMMNNIMTWKSSCHISLKIRDNYCLLMTIIWSCKWCGEYIDDVESYGLGITWYNVISLGVCDMSLHVQNNIATCYKWLQNDCSLLTWVMYITLHYDFKWLKNKNLSLHSNYKMMGK